MTTPSCYVCHKKIYDHQPSATLQCGCVAEGHVHYSCAITHIDTIHPMGVWEQVG